MKTNWKMIGGYWQSLELLATGESSQAIKTAPGAGKALRLTYLKVQIGVAAAQAITISDGTTVIMRIPASATGEFEFSSTKGVRLATNAALTATPAAAGPEAILYAEGGIDNV